MALFRLALPRGAVVVAAVAVAATTAGCGPVMSTYLIVDAEAKVAGAKAAQADTYAVYEYTAAEQYLKKAHEELGYADYGPAIDYAYKAADFAAQGIDKSKAADRSGATDGAPSVPASSVESTPSSSPPAAPRKIIIKKIDPAPAPTPDAGTTAPERP